MAQQGHLLRLYLDNFRLFSGFGLLLHHNAGLGRAGAGAKAGKPQKKCTRTRNAGNVQKKQNGFPFSLREAYIVTDSYFVKKKFLLPIVSLANSTGTRFQKMA
jgi:hypothetical protein